MGKALKSALIVDDSKTARLALKKMLEKHGVDSSMVESGEEALSFLQTQSPDVIFMDHMMPGMDGFQAVKAIKSSPGLAAIPIVMHTSKDGDIYIGQARALGAVDVLEKPATHENLLSVLTRVQDSAGSSANSSSTSDSSAKNSVSGARAKLSSDTMEIDAHAIAMAVELAEEQGNTVFDEQTTDAATARARAATPPPGSFSDAYSEFDREPESSFWGSMRQWLVALIWLLPIAWLLYLYLPAESSLQSLKQREQHYIEALEWSLNLRESYDFGDEPLSGDVLQVLRELLPRLRKAGFEGVIRLEGHIGEFCLSKVTLEDGSEISLLPEPDLPLTACGMIGYSPAEAVDESIKQSEAFGRFLQQAGLLRKESPIRLEIIAMGSSQPQFNYPEELAAVTTGDWNAVALSNNRVRMQLLPDKPPKT